MGRRLSLQLFASLTLLLVDASVAYSRAGGGGGYSSGGGSSSSSSSSSYSSSSGGGGASGTPFDFVLLVAMTGFFIWFAIQQRKAKAAAEARQASLEDAVARDFREADPDFDPVRLKQRVETAFMAIQRAWSEQDLETVRGFMSDGLHERFAIQLSEQRTLGYRNVLDGVKIRHAQILGLRRSDHFESIAIEIRAYATDYRVDLATDKEISGSRRPAHFTEVWEFLRARGASSANETGLFEGRCPNCSAPIEPARAWSCGSCASELSMAPPDWVLTEITQQSEWKMPGHERPVGWEDLVDLDPGLTLQQVEDRASVLFWRTMDAVRIGDPGPVMNNALPRFLEDVEFRRQLASTRYVGDCAVGSASVRAAIAGDAWNRVMIETRWTGGLFERREGDGPKALGERRHRGHSLVLARRTGITSQVGRCVTSGHCSGCGAPEQGGLDGLCSFCGVAINDGRDWMIEKMLEEGDPAIREFVQAAAGKPRAEWQSVECTRDAEGPASAREVPAEMSKVDALGEAEREALLSWCFVLAYCDVEFDAEERAMLESLHEALDVPSATARALRQKAQFGRLEVEVPTDASDRRRWIEVLERLATSDDRFDHREKALLARLQESARKV